MSDRDALLSATPNEVATVIAEAMGNWPRGSAVGHALGLYLRAYEALLSNDVRAETAQRRARAAFRLAIPPITDRASVLMVIACTTAGVTFGVLSEREASSILYGCQVALSALGKEGPCQAVQVNVAR